MDPGSRKNQLVLTRIMEWASGKSSDLDPSLPSKRKSDALETNWKLRLCHGVDSWVVEIPPNGSLSFLTELSFRCLNSKVPTSITNIRLYHGASRLSYDGASLTSTAIKDGDPLRVETTSAAEPNLGFYGSESMCLVKLYRGRCDKARVCYWLPKDTNASLLSLMIRFWHWSESDLIAQPVSSSELEVWTPNTKSEDFLERYWSLDTSNSLRDIIRTYGVEGWLENDPIFEKRQVQQRRTLFDERFLTLDRTFKVRCTLKILLHDYQTPRKKATLKASSTSRLSRVSPCCSFS